MGIFDDLLANVQSAGQGALTAGQNYYANNKDAINGALWPALATPIAMAVASSLSKRAYRPQAMGRAFDMMGGLTLNQLTAPGRQKDAYLQGAINAGQLVPAEPGYTGADAQQFGGMNFRPVEKFGQPGPLPGTGVPSGATWRTPTAADAGQNKPMPYTPPPAPQYDPSLQLLANQPKTPQNLALYGTMLSNATHNQRLLELERIKYALPNYRSTTVMQGGVPNNVLYDTRGMSPSLTLGQAPAKGNPNAIGSLTPDTKLLPPDTDPQTIAHLQSAGWQISQGGDGKYLAEAPPKPPTDYQAAEAIRGFRKDYEAEVGKIKNIPATVSYLKSLAPPRSTVPPVTDSHFIIEFLRAANALGNFGIARVNSAEMNLLQHARSLEDTASNFYNLKIEGNLLTDEQRQGMIQVLEHMAGASQEVVNNINAQYRTMLPSWIPAEKIIGPEPKTPAVAPPTVAPPTVTPGAATMKKVTRDASGNLVIQ